MGKLTESNVRNWSLGLVLVMMSVSCAHQKMYREPDLGIEETAILEARVPIWIASIDGEKVSSLSVHDSMFVKLLPGPHTVEVIFQKSDMRHLVEHGFPELQRTRTYGEQPVKLSIRATAGCKYLVEYKLENDEGSKKRVWSVRIVKLESACNPVTKNAS